MVALTPIQRIELEQLHAEAVSLLGSVRYLAHSIPASLLTSGRQAATNRVVLALLVLANELNTPDPDDLTLGGL